MENQRRSFLKAFLPGALLASAVFSADSALGQNTNPPRPPLPPPINPVPAPAFRPPSMAQLRKNQREITKDVDQLFALAQQLKRQADKSDASQELSVALIEKTQEIEKLAKKIHDLAIS